MPQRNRTQTVTGGPQGEDARLIILMPTQGELRGHAKAIARVERELSGLIKAAESGALSEEQTGKVERLSDEMSQAMSSYMAAHVVTWNWVNDEGEPLPTPFNHPEVFDALTSSEVEFIGQALNGATEQQKAAQKK